MRKAERLVQEENLKSVDVVVELLDAHSMSSANPVLREIVGGAAALVLNKADLADEYAMPWVRYYATQKRLSVFPWTP